MKAYRPSLNDLVEENPKALLFVLIPLVSSLCERVKALEVEIELLKAKTEPELLQGEKENDPTS